MVVHPGASVPARAPSPDHAARIVAALAGFARRLLADADLAREMGLHARRHALQRFGIDRFVADWDATLKEVTR